jgi:membrane protein YdbS with pleckstrin-like domain
MVLVRFIALGLLIAFGVCMGLYTLTGEPIWRRRGFEILKWLVVIGMLFFGVLILERAAVFL